MSDATITIKEKTAQNIVKEIEAMQQSLELLKKKVLKLLPPAYGSDEWWDQENKQAIKEIKQGRGIVLHDKKELQTFLDSLKNS